MTDTNTIVAIIAVFGFLCFAGGWIARGKESDPISEPTETGV